MFSTVSEAYVVSGAGWYNLWEGALGEGIGRGHWERALGVALRECVQRALDFVRHAAEPYNTGTVIGFYGFYYPLPEKRLVGYSV